MSRKPSFIVTELAAMVAASVLKKAMEQKPVMATSAPSLDGYQTLVNALQSAHGYETGISPFLTDAEYQEEITRLGYELDRGLRAVAWNPGMEPDDGRDGK